MQTLTRETAASYFTDLLPAQDILYHEEQLRPYECDALTAYRELPLLVLLPTTATQVAEVVKRCRDRDIPIVTRGAGTGLSGGAYPNRTGVLLSTARLNQIVEINTQSGFARVQPGVRNLAVSEEAKKHGLYYAPDPSSQIACSIGGNIAENSGGVHCLKYGLTVHNVIEVTIVTSEGELITIGSEAYDSAGYELLAAISGSEGLLGIVVEAKLRLLPISDAREVLLIAFDSVEAASQTVAAIIAEGIIPAGLEMMDRMVLKAAEQFCNAGYPVDAQAVLLCELDGYGASLQWEVEQVKAICESLNAIEVRQARDESERELFWAGRKAAFPALGRLSPDYYCMDGTIPRKQLAHVLEQIQVLSKQYGLAVANVFHAGDGNLHPLILYDANEADELERAELLGGEILELCVAVGGTITGEHGVGIEKLNQMCVQFADPELLQFDALKEAFDPYGILNPGKAIPTLHRCAEFGAMHVHKGELPFPDLPRF